MENNQLKQTIEITLKNNRDKNALFLVVLIILILVSVTISTRTLYLNEDTSRKISNQNNPSSEEKLQQTETDSQNQFIKGYQVENGGVYFNGSLLKEADSTTFKTIEKTGTYGKDQKHVFYVGQIIPEADPVSFSVFANQTYPVVLSKDKNNIFYETNPLKLNLDLDKTQVLGNWRVIKDQQKVYVTNPNWDFEKPSEPLYTEVKYANAETFEYLGPCKWPADDGLIGAGDIQYYYKDKNNVFIDNSQLKGADSSSFKYLGLYEYYKDTIDNNLAYEPQYVGFKLAYAQDKNRVYFACGRTLERADTISFKDLKDGYAVDKIHAWFTGVLLDTTGTESFINFGGRYAKSANEVYFNGKRISKADPKTFTVISGKVLSEYGVNNNIEQYNEIFFGKDKNYVYTGWQVMDGINPENCTSQDINGCQRY